MGDPDTVDYSGCGQALAYGVPWLLGACVIMLVALLLLLIPLFPAVWLASKIQITSYPNLNLTIFGAIFYCLWIAILYKTYATWKMVFSYLSENVFLIGLLIMFLWMASIMLWWLFEGIRMFGVWLFTK